MGTATTVAVVAATSSGSAATAAMIARERRECGALVSSYDASVATVAEMRGYAHCVGILHPAPITDPTVVIAIKVAIVFVILSGLIGAWRGFSDPCPTGGSRVAEAFFGALLGLCFGGLVCVVSSMLFLGVVFLVGG